MGDWCEIIFSAMGIRWICLTVAALALGIATIVLARFRVIQSRPIAACMVLSIFAHVLLFLAAYFVEFFETPGFAVGPAISFRLVAGDGPTGELMDEPEGHVEPVEESVVQWFPADLDLPESPQDARPAETEIVHHEHETVLPRAIDDLFAPDLLQDNVPHDNLLLPDNEPSIAQHIPPEQFPPDIVVAQDASSVPEPGPSEIVADSADIPSDHPMDSSLPQPPLIATSDGSSDFVAEGWTPLTSRPKASDRSDSFDPSDGPDANHEHSHSRFGHRFATDRNHLLQLYGGNADTERAVRNALRWLANHQSPDGRWIAADYGAGSAGVIDFQDRRGTGMKADNGVTALALLAMMGAGETPTRGEFQQNVQRGFDYLCRSQSSSGDLAGNADHYARMYCHGMATLALGEVCSISPQRQWEPTLQRALEFSRTSQHRATGGWRYQAGDTGDTSQFGWQVMALISGQHAGIPIHPTTRYGMEQYLRSVSSGNAGGLASYRHFMPPTPSMTAESLVCRLLLRPELSPTVDEAVRYILAHPPDEPVLNLYYCYYGSLALHLADASWESWNHRMQMAILSRQIPRGEHAGSWGLDTVWGRCGGRVYTTAMAALSLEVYYRYLPLVDRTLARR